MLGTVASGLVLGLLISRALSGIVADLFGWRAIYVAAAGIMLVLSSVMARRLPHLEPRRRVGYGTLLASVIRTVRDRTVVTVMLIGAAWADPPETAPIRPAGAAVASRSMDMISGERVAAAGLDDWCKLAQGLHARFLTPGFAAGARFATAIGAAGDAAGHHPTITIGTGHVDLELVSADAVYRPAPGTELPVEWVTEQDLDLARTISGIAAEQGLAPDPSSAMVVELGLDTPASGRVAPVWAALLTGRADARGHGSPSDEVRDPTGRTPNLWFGDAAPEGAPGGRWHVEVYVAPAEAERRIGAAVAAGGTVVDGATPGLTVVADPDGNRAAVCVDVSAYRPG